MARCRLIAFIVTFTLITVGLGWWFEPYWRLASSEAIVGTWRMDTRAGRPNVFVRFAADGSCEFWHDADGVPTDLRRCYWRTVGHELVMDMEGSPTRRALRPIGRVVTLRAAPVNRCTFEITGDRLVMIGPYRAVSSATRVDNGSEQR